MKISVIVPIYNSSRFLSQCIKSILNQDFKDFEIILVNDGSTDDSEILCSDFKKIDKRIILINKINEGAEKARFSGLEKANGKYIFFIDADDWLAHKKVLSNLYEIAEISGSDYVEIGSARVLDKYGIIKKKNYGSGIIEISQPELLEEYFISFFGYNKLSVNIWGKLYRRSTLENTNLQPLNLYMGEDLAFNMYLFPYLKKISILDELGYYYRFGGFTTKYNDKFIGDSKRLFFLKEEMIKKYNYKKASKLIRIELKNVLKTEIIQLINYRKGSKTEIIKKISNEIDDPIYKNLYDIESNSAFWDEPFVRAFMNRDVEQIYDICRKEMIHQFPKRCLKKFVFNFLNYFN